MSSPGIEPGPHLRTVVCDPAHPEDVIASTCQRLAEESNLVLQLRRLPCGPSHSQGKYPDLDSNQGLELRRLPCNPLHHREASTSGRFWRPPALPGARSRIGPRTRWSLGSFHALRFQRDVPICLADEFRPALGVQKPLHHRHHQSIVSAPTRTRTRNLSLEARCDVLFTIRAQAEGKGVEPSSRLARTALAPRPGQPYPATFQESELSSGPPGSRTPITWLQARRLPVGPAAQVAEVGVEPTESRGSRPRRFFRLRTRPRGAHLPRIARQVAGPGVAPGGRSL